MLKTLQLRFITTEYECKKPNAHKTTMAFDMYHLVQFLVVGQLQRNYSPKTLLVVAGSL